MSGWIFPLPIGVFPKCLAHWVHRIDPFILRFPFPCFLEGIRWYGLAYVFSFLAAHFFFLLCARRGRLSLSGRDGESLLVTLGLGILIGGRMGYVFLYDFAFWRQEPLWIFQFWSGGMSFHGAVIGAGLALALLARKRHLPLLPLADAVCAIAPLGIFFGRIANFINGELWGKITNLPWAIRFPQSVAPATPIAAIPPRHPSQLYEAVLEGGLLLLILQRKFWKYPARSRGCLTADFLWLYALLRIFAEIFREPDAPLWGPFSRGQVLSLGLGILGIGFRLWAGEAGRGPSPGSRDGSTGDAGGSSPGPVEGNSG
ncbi:MAG: prolipoprotein diacylglyceryl transferase [Puniceicoccales bacterium]|jgi:phosphatidylglycerol:prolipoprotein diacylglycerol transferase|nr:prolipoprotein diacylglyceryl transferase [Puniceicoccales bacterium]